jgi:hypothetical protein
MPNYSPSYSMILLQMSSILLLFNFLCADHSPQVIGNDPNDVLTAAHQQTNAHFLQVQLQITPNNIPNLNNLGISLPCLTISILLHLSLDQDGLSLHQNCDGDPCMECRQVCLLCQVDC